MRDKQGDGSDVGGWTTSRDRQQSVWQPTFPGETTQGERWVVVAVFQSRCRVGLFTDVFFQIPYSELALLLS